MHSLLHCLLLSPLLSFLSLSHVLLPPLPLSSPPPPPPPPLPISSSPTSSSSSPFLHPPPPSGWDTALSTSLQVAKSLSTVLLHCWRLYHAQQSVSHRREGASEVYNLVCCWFGLSPLAACSVPSYHLFSQKSSHWLEEEGLTYVHKCLLDLYFASGILNILISFLPLFFNS